MQVLDRTLDVLRLQERDALAHLQQAERKQGVEVSGAGPGVQGSGGKGS